MLQNLKINLLKKSNFTRLLIFVLQSYSVNFAAHTQGRCLLPVKSILAKNEYCGFVAITKIKNDGK
jgi:hypothetical protein